MTKCRDCDLQIKYVGNGVWVDHTMGGSCWKTNRPHTPGGEVIKERIGLSGPNPHFVYGGEA